MTLYITRSTSRYFLYDLVEQFCLGAQSLSGPQGGRTSVPPQNHEPRGACLSARQLMCIIGRGHNTSHDFRHLCNIALWQSAALGRRMTGGGHTALKIVELCSCSLLVMFSNGHGYLAIFSGYCMSHNRVHRLGAYLGTHIKSGSQPYPCN